MTTLLIKNAQLLVTMDDHRREIPDGGLLFVMVLLKVLEKQGYYRFRQMK